MNTVSKIFLCAVTLCAPAVTFAHSEDTITRAQVREELVQLERAGYHPATGEDPHYPDDIQAAEAKVAANASAAQTSQAVGGVPMGSHVEAGSPRRTASSKPDDCVGPVSFCNIFSGG
ncbi:DUF4148 domain-containing protein [Paraburkholderia sp. RL18-103-BIB-C]|uniref:DUF4148 domain-containing protein n=1 Tax=Paraburkholderia sp. RL18-103-BIB-C TaxID=3031637 RepID=UPI0038BAC7FA